MKKRLYLLALIVAGLASFASCSDDDDFSASSSNFLTFEKDTLSLDTVFSTVPSPHKQFMVYNNSGSGIRISNARLENGNQTGFRVNVNGTYLSPQQGYQVSDMELRNGDSLRVFVELTSVMQNSNLPSLVSDDLVFTLESGVQQKVNLKAMSWDAQILRGTVFTENTTLANTDGKPIVIYDSLRVMPAVTLTIAPGTTLYFHNGAGIKVEGTLKAMGEKDKEITMRCDRLDRMVSNLMYDNNPGQWGGIRFGRYSYGNEINYTNIFGGMTGLYCEQTEDLTQHNLTIRNSTIHNMKSNGLYAIMSNINMENTQVSNVLDTCLYFRGGNIDMNHCTIAQYYPFDSSRGPALAFCNAVEYTPYPLNMVVKNSLIKGYANDVILWSYGYTVTETPINAMFHNCLLRTPMPFDKDAAMFANSFLENIADPLTQPETSFVQFDTDNFFYNFTPLPGTLPIGNANPAYALPIDRNGNPRNMSTPDIGCFEIAK